MAVNVVAFVPICAFILHRPWVSGNNGAVSGCSVDAAHSSAATYAEGNTFSLFSVKTTIGWAIRAIFHGVFVSVIAMYVVAPSTFVSSQSAGDSGSAASKDETAVGTFILYCNPLPTHPRRMHCRSSAASCSLSDIPASNLLCSSATAALSSPPLTPSSSSPTFWLCSSPTLLLQA